MKETIILTIILIIIISGNMLLNKYLKNSSKVLIADLKDLKNIIKNNSQDYDKLTKKANNIYNDWQKTEEKWGVIVLHQELDAIETSLIKMKTDTMR